MKTLLRSFAGGEITPELYGRIDLTKFQTGLATCRNFIVLPHGPAARRAGFEYVLEAKDSTRQVRLIPFSYAADQTVVLEFGHQYIRFHVNGDTLLESAKAIVSIAGSTVTVTAHGWSNGDWVFIGNRFHKITVTGADTFTTTDLWGVSTTASGATAARVYTLTTTYVETDLFALHFAQDSDVLTLVHPSYPAAELKRLGATNWTLTAVSFAAPTNAPTTLAVTATIAENKNLTTQKYVLTTVAADGVTESLACTPVAASNNLTLAGNYNTLTWSAVAGATRYNAYKLRGGIYGYIGQARPNPGVVTRTISNITRPGGGDKTVTVTTTAAHGFATNDLVLIAATGEPTFDGAWVITVTGATTFTYVSVTDGNHTHTTGTASIPELQIIDDNVTADTSVTPPEDIIGLNSGASDYPGAVTHYEQRRWFAGTSADRQTVWATRNGTQANLTSSVPSRDDDALEFRIAAQQQNAIRHLLPLSDIIALTVGGEFRIFADSAPNITPTSLSVKPQGYSGAANVQPALTSGSILYVQAQGSRIRELAYNWQSSAYSSIDVSIMAPHLFNGFSMADLAYARAPVPALWAVRSDGMLLGMTYVPEQQVYGWHQHTTSGVFESVCVVSEGLEDVLYAVARRTVNGRSVRYIERLRSRQFTAQEDAFFVDSGLTYDGAPVSSLTGLWHLEGQSVQILADGAVHPARTVTAGAISLDDSYGVVHVGLAYTSDLKTLPLAFEGAPAAGQYMTKNVNGVAMRVTQSSLVKAGPSFTKLTEYPARDHTDPYDSPPALRTGELRFAIGPSWNPDGAVCVRQDQPLPLTVLGIALDVATGS